MYYCVSHATFASYFECPNHQNLFSLKSQSHTTAGMHRCNCSKAWRCYSCWNVQAAIQHP